MDSAMWLDRLRPGKPIRSWLETCITNRNNTGTIFIAGYVNANIEIVFVFKIVVTSLTPVRIDMLNVHYFYVNTVFAKLNLIYTN
jgi:hypothetical protein